MQHGATQHLAQRMSASGNKSEVSGGLQKVKGRNRFGLVWLQVMGAFCQVSLGVLDGISVY